MTKRHDRQTNMTDKHDRQTNRQTRQTDKRTKRKNDPHDLAWNKEQECLTFVPAGKSALMSLSTKSSPIR